VITRAGKIFWKCETRIFCEKNSCLIPSKNDANSGFLLKRTNLSGRRCRFWKYLTFYLPFCRVLCVICLQNNHVKGKVVHGIVLFDLSCFLNGSARKYFKLRCSTNSEHRRSFGVISFECMRRILRFSHILQCYCKKYDG
jgi:hypothetical protein